MNVSSNATVPEIDTLPEPARILLITLGVIITTTGIPGNILTAVAIVRCKSLRTRLNIFIVNLCIADVVAVGYVYPFVTFDLILGRHPVSLLWCKLNLLVTYLLSPTTFLTVLLITLSRYMKIIHEDKFDKLFGVTNTIVFCVLSWIPGGVVVTLTAADLGHVDYVHFAHLCLAADEDTVLIATIILPFVLLTYISSILCYLRVWSTLRAHATNLRSHENYIFTKIKLDSNRKQISMSFLVVLIYICLTIPALVIFSFGIHASEVSRCVSLMLYFLNSSVNCIVYGAMHKSIRKYYQNLLPSDRLIRVRPVRSIA